MKDEFDAVVIGAGLAGLCCAGELVAQGKRPLLLCETSEVGAVFPVRTLGNGNRAFIQHLTWQLGWGGGWWYQLARRLNIPLKLYPGVEWEMSIAGVDGAIAVPTCGTAASLTDVLMAGFPMIDAKNLESVLRAALDIPYEELLAMHDVRLADWLEDHGADDLTAIIILTLGGMGNDLRVSRAREHLSVLGGLGLLRILLCGEGTLPVIYPNIREGLCIPLAQAIEEGGGEVWRRAKVDKVLIEGGRVTGVALVDGREITADTVAIAAGNPRIPSLLDPVPPEIVPALEYVTSIDVQDFNQFLLLSKPVVSDRRCNFVFDLQTMSMLSISFSLTEVAPWSTEPGKQLVLNHAAYSQEELVEVGGPEVAVEKMTQALNDQFPGIIDAVEETVVVSNRHHWFAPVCVGPKIPRTIPSVDGLYFVGDGSQPSGGLWTEAAASCGILGARDIIAAGGN